MGFLDRFRRSKPKVEEPEFDPIADLVLERLKVGYLLDYDLRTWKVTDHTRYRFNDGGQAEEWELTAERDKIYLERSTGDGESWALSNTLPIGKLGNVRSHILENEDPPDQIEYDGVTYYLEGSLGGQMISADGTEHDLIVWELVDDTEERFLAIQQWSETEVTAAVGRFVEDYQFTNILPGDP